MIVLAYGHRGVRAVVMSSSWTVAQKLTFMEQMALGPADVKTPAEFFERIEEDAASSPNPAARAADASIADGRVLWVNPDTGLRV